MNDETIRNTEASNRFAEAVTEVNAMMREGPINEPDAVTRLKLKINNLLWEELPGGTPLFVAEQIACTFVYHIRKETEEYAG